MKASGGCYCGDIRYQIDGPAEAAFQCHCRECQYFSGGEPATAMAFDEGDVIFTRGNLATFARSDLENPVPRYFCPRCGTHIGNYSPRRPDLMILKVGTLDDPSVFRPQLAIFLCDAQPFHHVEDGLPAFQKRP
ncbi:GFA family protein [Aestuariivita boseongensis]|uniref:GFA family protein n=1 Tax=Aestuariivita boseongensis TaxID=1470562 RepID=UPI0006812D29|nr:GFA family protein [Aestuariivita boseongensis]